MYHNSFMVLTTINTFFWRRLKTKLILKHFMNYILFYKQLNTYIRNLNNLIIIKSVLWWMKKFDLCQFFNFYLILHQDTFHGHDKNPRAIFGGFSWLESGVEPDGAGFALRGAPVAFVRHGQRLPLLLILEIRLLGSGCWSKNRNRGSVPRAMGYF